MNRQIAKLSQAILYDRTKVVERQLCQSQQQQQQQLLARHRHRSPYPISSCVPSMRSIMSSSNKNSNPSTTMTTSSSNFPVTASIQSKLEQSFQPYFLQVINESHMHNVPRDSETHFKVVIVSSKFDNMTNLIQRHRMVHETLQEELEHGPVHALSIVAKSPTQWQEMLANSKPQQQQHNKGTPVTSLLSSIIPPSPACRGGDGSLPSRRDDDDDDNNKNNKSSQ